MAARLPIVRRQTEFEDQVRTLQNFYADIGTAIDSFCEALAMGHLLATPRKLPGKDPPAYAHKVDYPPFGAEGRGRFLVVYEERKALNPMRDADELRLLAISVAPEYLC